MADDDSGQDAAAPTSRLPQVSIPPAARAPTSPLGEPPWRAPLDNMKREAIVTLCSLVEDYALGMPARASAARLLIEARDREDVPADLRMRVQAAIRSLE